MGATGLLVGSYNPAFVGLSVAMAILASAASLDVADRIGGSVGWLRLVWILAAGIAMGGGIWAMHFIAMLAFSLPVPLTYDIPPTLGSLLLAIAVTSIAFVIVCGGRFRAPRLILGGLIMGLGVAGMHYTGMAALRGPAEMSFRPVLVAASIAIAIAASTAALWIALRVTGFAWRLAAAVVMGLAVSSMHYTGMAATCFTADPSLGSAGTTGLDRGTLALMVAVGAVVILSLALTSAAVDRRFAALRQRETEESRRAADQAETALRELKATQQSLIQAEKMASLSRLTAGVAHEINTPIGTALTAATSLQRRTEEFVRGVEAGNITKAAALRYAAIAAESSDLIVSNVRRAAELIQSFKQVAVDQTSGECREFELGSYLGEVVRSLSPRLKQAPHDVTIDCPPHILVMGFPGALAQVVTNLLVNSVIHAYPDGRTGQIALRVRRLSGELLELVYSDDGSGIPEANIDRIFDPFFTTRRAAGGTGLGLHIVFNIVTQTLKGTIRVDTSSTGTRFIMQFPRRIPVRALTSAEVETV